MCFSESRISRKILVLSNIYETFSKCVMTYRIYMNRIFKDYLNVALTFHKYFKIFWDTL